MDINDIYSFAKNGISNSSVIRKLIEDDTQSKEKKFMLVSDRYYENKNDILKKDFREYYSQGIQKINENRSNEKIPHNFLKLLIDQAVNYIAGNKITYKSKDEQFHKYLDEYLMFDFDDNNIIWLKEARKKGLAYIHFYYDQQGFLDYALIPSEQIIPIYKNSLKRELQEVIRYYAINAIDEKGKPCIRKKVEWWTDKEVKYFIEDNKGDFEQQESLSHWSYMVNGTPDIVEGVSWGKVPFVELLNNDDATGDLQDIKSFIDCYDLLESEFVNQIADIREILIKVLGYSGASADEILQAFRGTGIVKIDDSNGDIDILKSEIPVDARKTALQNLKENIFTIGQGVDIHPEKVGSQVSGIALRMLYGALDLKCSASIRKLHKALYEFVWFITEDYNRRYNANINYRDIEFSFNKNALVNESEIITSLVNAKGVISNQTIWELFPNVDPVIEAERMEKQEEEELNQFEKSMNRQPTELQK